jgi:hypothetical protein
MKKVLSSITLMLCALLSVLTLTGCACGFMDVNRFGGSPSCDRQVTAERSKVAEKRFAQIASVKQRADRGDVKAQMEIGFFHVYEHHEQSNRALGLSYYQKAAAQGDLPALRTYLLEAHQDCRTRARNLGMKETDGPQFAPHCAADWAAVENLGEKSCVLVSQQNNPASLQVAIGQTFELASKGDDADFWYTVALTHCLTPGERTGFGEKAFSVWPRGLAAGADQLRGAMWLSVSGREKFPSYPLPSPEIEAKARERLAMLREKVARSGIRPEL